MLATIYKHIRLEAQSLLQSTATMVQYKPVLARHKKEPYDRGYRCDTYWMLGSYINRTVRELKEYLAAHDYRYSKGATKAVLIDAAGRCQRGLLSYERYDITELRTFRQVRNISPRSRPKTAPQLARLLEKADDEATFPRFLELPPELRNRVYEFHFRDYDEISTRHRQPPLTMVPLIRAEALPVFYKSVTFTWDSSLDTNFCINKHKFTGDSHNLLMMPVHNLAKIKNFKVHWTQVSRGSRGVTNRHVEYSVHLSEGSKATKTVTFVGKDGKPMPQNVEGVIRSRLRRVGYEDNGWTLQRQHLLLLE